jgi:lipopolysaccharide cholinephosphotransferase
MNLDKLFPDEREDGQTQIKQCHLVLLRMFKIFHYLCAKHEIKYFLCSGTLKAAIRHKGFKPWDDDLDIGMTRDNYEKFLQYAVPELPYDIFFQNPETDKYFPVCHRVEAKLRDKYSSYLPLPDQKDEKYHKGIMVDILVFDRAYFPNNFFIFLQNRTLKFLFAHKRTGNKARANVLKFIAKYSPFPLVYSNSYIDGRDMIKKGANYFTKKEISSLAKIRFEDTEAFIPCGWEGYLKRKYGNYMDLPSKDKQKGHHSEEVPNPFTPCDHTEILYWNNKGKTFCNLTPFKGRTYS